MSGTNHTLEPQGRLLGDHGDLERNNCFWRGRRDPQTESTTIRIAILDHCTCAALAREHYSMYEEIMQASAVAISYVWGEFDRQNISLCHIHDKPGSFLAIKLGAEWNSQNFLDQLVQLSQKHGGCWIDQFCIKQDEVEIRKALAAVSSVYESLLVVIIWPGSLCRCLEESLQIWTDCYKALSVTSKSNIKVHCPKF